MRTQDASKDKAGELELFEQDRALPARDDDEHLIRAEKNRFPIEAQQPKTQGPTLTYFVLPAIFLAVTLLGGMRLAAPDSAFIFLKPALVCLIFAAVLLVLYFRSGLIDLGGWVSEDLPLLHNTANIAVLLTLFTASAQLFNSLLPEQGLPFWVVGFCFFWTLWNNLFAEFDPRKLLRSLGALFGLAFVVKYLVLANLTAQSSGSWLQRIWESPGQEAFTYLLDLPRYSTGTGYIQFFACVLYLGGLFLMPSRVRND